MLKQESLVVIIEDQTRRALWEVKNVIDCIPNELWNKLYCEMPLWKHVYHMLHSLDLWFINPRDINFQEPSFHEKDLNNLDVTSEKRLTREDLDSYYNQTAEKIRHYIDDLQDNELLEMPANCDYTKFTLILAQFRHLDSHMGMIMGFIIDDTNQWPRVVGLEKEIPQGDYNKFFE
ncbi:hypothetical protein [Anaerosporobacter sp.]